MTVHWVTEEYIKASFQAACEVREETRETLADRVLEPSIPTTYDCGRIATTAS